MKLKRQQRELWTGDLQRLAIGQQRRCQYCIIVTERRKGKFFEAGKFRSGSLLALQFKEEEGRKRSSETRSGGEQCCWAEPFSSTDPLFAIIRQFPIQGFKVFQIDRNSKGFLSSVKHSYIQHSQLSQCFKLTCGISCFEKYIKNGEIDIECNSKWAYNSPAKPRSQKWEPLLLLLNVRW